MKYPLHEHLDNDNSFIAHFLLHAATDGLSEGEFKTIRDDQEFDLDVRVNGKSMGNPEEVFQNWWKQIEELVEAKAQEILAGKLARIRDTLDNIETAANECSADVLGNY